jgi:hypothetical protein
MPNVRSANIQFIKNYLLRFQSSMSYGQDRAWHEQVLRFMQRQHAERTIPGSPNQPGFQKLLGSMAMVGRLRKGFECKSLFGCGFDAFQIVFKVAMPKTLYA